MLFGLSLHNIWMAPSNKYTLLLLIQSICFITVSIIGNLQWLHYWTIISLKHFDKECYESLYLLFLKNIHLFLLSLICSFIHNQWSHETFTKSPCNSTMYFPEDILLLVSVSFEIKGKVTIRLKFFTFPYLT